MGRRRIDETGNSYGKWEVVEYSCISTNREAMWLCKCSECGSMYKVRGSQLRTGRSTQCRSCADRGNRLLLGEASFNMLFLHYKNGAKRRGYLFEIPKERFRELTHQVCYYCGSGPANRCSKWDFNGDYVYNGLDRVDNDKGYVEGNIVPCCGECNKTKKGSISIDIVEKIYHFIHRGEDERYQSSSWDKGWQHDTLHTSRTDCRSKPDAV